MVKKILMVDDDAADTAIFRRIIHSLDTSIEIDTASNGEVAMKLLISAIRPDVIFLDLIMPGMDGIECLTKLKANRGTRNIPVVLYTASDNKMERMLGLRLGAFEVIVKNSNLEKLTQQVQQVLYSSQLQ